MAAAIDGWNRAQGGDEEPPALTDAEFDAMLERHAGWLANGQENLGFLDAPSLFGGSFRIVSVEVFLMLQLPLTKPPPRQVAHET